MYGYPPQTTKKVPVFRRVAKNRRSEISRFPEDHNSTQSKPCKLHGSSYAKRPPKTAISAYRKTNKMYGSRYAESIGDTSTHDTPKTTRRKIDPQAPENAGGIKPPQNGHKLPLDSTPHTH